MQNGVDSQVSVIGDKGTELASGSTVVESYDPDLEVNKAIEPKSRRKKHRPKVIREGKPKQTPKQRTPKPSDDANGTPKQKRKYVRKNTTNLPSTPPLESGSEALGCGQVPAPADKSCRQALEFDLEEDQLNKNNLNDANRAPKQKRKYARKSKTNTSSTTPLESSGAEANGCKVQRVAKSCKKAIDFELEDRLQENNFSPRLTDMPPIRIAYVSQHLTSCVACCRVGCPHPAHIIVYSDFPFVLPLGNA